MKPGDFSIYKTSGALQVSLIPPAAAENGYMRRAGAILLTVAPGLGDKTWDWRNKITFALGMQDICNLMSDDLRKRELFHQNSGVYKKLRLTPGQGKYAGTYMLTIGEKREHATRQVSVPLDSGEWFVFKKLLLDASPMLIGWR